jgi:isoleucyl-tRNA synthetase
MPAFAGKLESIHMTEFDRLEKGWLNESEQEDWAKLANYREQVLKLMEESRQRKELGSSLEGMVLFQYAPEEESLVKRFENFLPDLFIASQVQLVPGEKTNFEVKKAEGTKCMRCWQIRKDVGSNPAHPNVCGRCAEVLNQLLVEKA